MSSTKSNTSSYFKVIDSRIKAYILGHIINNIDKNKTVISTSNTISKLYINFTDQEVKGLTIIQEIMKNIMEDDEKNEEDIFYTSSEEMIENIFHQVNDGKVSTSVNNEYFISHNIKEHSKYFLIAFFEKYSMFTICKNKKRAITLYHSDIVNLKAFANFFDIPVKYHNNCILYEESNALDLIGQLYCNERHIFDMEYIKYITTGIFELDVPILKCKKNDINALVPVKANYSDVGYDLTAIGVSKKINNKTILCNTGIQLEIPSTYYVEIVPRSSIIKSGYMLANSIGVIDSSYKGELLIALVKIDETMPDITFPFRCCQLIMKKQIFPQLEEVNEMSKSKRGEGGFGSSG